MRNYFSTINSQIQDGTNQKLFHEVWLPARLKIHKKHLLSPPMGPSYPRANAICSWLISKNLDVCMLGMATNVCGNPEKMENQGAMDQKHSYMQI